MHFYLTNKQPYKVCSSSQLIIYSYTFLQITAMKKMYTLLKEINAITLKIELDYPELYEYLDENPITMPNMTHPIMNTLFFQNS